VPPAKEGHIRADVRSDVRELRRLHGNPPGLRSAINVAAGIGGCRAKPRMQRDCLSSCTTTSRTAPARRSDRQSVCAARQIKLV